MIQTLRPAFVLLLLFTLLTGIAYPLAITAIARVAFPAASTGSPIVENGTTKGSHLIGQAFSTPGYFHPRPSASSYDGKASGGTNFGPLSKKLIDRVGADVAALGFTGPVPGDAITASASGLDPDISPDNALAQVPRVASARGLDDADVTALVHKLVQGRFLGLIGEPRVNVLALNMALDSMVSP